MTYLKREIIRMLDRMGLTRKMTRKNFLEHIQPYATPGKTLDIGSGHGPYQNLFPNRLAVDIVDQPGVDVVADVHNLSTLKNEEFEVVLCTEGLEHFYDPKQAISELTRVLKKGGVLILTTRFIFPLHEVPHDYYRFTEYGLRYLLREYEIVTLLEDGNTLETLATLYERIGYQTITLGWKPLKLMWFLHAKITLLFRGLLTKEYGDVTGKIPVKHLMTSGYLVIAKKR